jgi:hypothetical protein
MAEITGPGAIQHIWMTPTGNWRFSILRFYWDDETEPSVETPVGDFFGAGWGGYSHLNSLAVTINPGSAFNCYWAMPFRKKCRITMTNINVDNMTLYYQVDYTLTTFQMTLLTFMHTQKKQLVKMVFSLIDNIEGRGQYVALISHGAYITMAGG